MMAIVIGISSWLLMAMWLINHTTLRVHDSYQVIAHGEGNAMYLVTFDLHGKSYATPGRALECTVYQSICSISFSVMRATSPISAPDKMDVVAFLGERRVELRHRGDSLRRETIEWSANDHSTKVQANEWDTNGKYVLSTGGRFDWGPIRPGRCVLWGRAIGYYSRCVILAGIPAVVIGISWYDIGKLVRALGQSGDACPRCGYPLHSLRLKGCPECGWKREDDIC